MFSSVHCELKLFQKVISGCLVCYDLFQHIVVRMLFTASHMERELCASTDLFQVVKMAISGSYSNLWAYKLAIVA